MGAITFFSPCFCRKCAFCICFKEGGGELDRSRHGEVEVDENMGRDESSEYTGVRSRVTARLVTPTPAAVPCGRTALAGGRGTAADTSLRGATMREIPGIPVHSSAGTPGFFYVYAPCNIDRGQRVWGHCQPRRVG